MNNFFVKIGKWLKKYFYNPTWRCVACGKEIFEGDFCKDCKEKLPFNDKIVCEHCGRKIIAPENYCTTCKGKLIYTDKGRSVFNYQPPVNVLIKKMKYGNGRYLADIFSSYLSVTYFKNYFNADLVTYIPMTEKSEKKRGYNQSKLLAEFTAKRINLPIEHCLKKIKETTRQAKLSKAERLKNLQGAFKVVDKKTVNGKSILVVDDVTTTGSTGEAVAEKLKRAGAKNVYLLTVASVPPIDKY